MIDKTGRGEKKQPKAIVSTVVKSYGDDPFFVKKTNDSKRILEKHGFPAEILKRSRIR